MRLLDKLYAAGAVLAAVFMVADRALTLSQVVGRVIGVVVPDAGDLAGYAMAAATFLALAHTFRSGGHIRVNLLLAHVGPRLRYGLECWCLLVLATLGALFAAFSTKLVIGLLRVRRRLYRHDAGAAVDSAALDGAWRDPARNRGARRAGARAARAASPATSTRLKAREAIHRVGP